MPMQVNLTTQVNSKKIRREQHNGREHWVVPSHTLPSNVVMNGGLYPSAEIDAHYTKLEGTLAPLGHPQVNGAYVSAFSPEGINVGHVGAWNRNVKKAGNRVYVEKWIDVEVAQRTDDGKRLLERLESLEKGEGVPPIHTSVAVFLDRIDANDQQKQGGYEWIAKIHGIDHDAILLDEVGAATPEQGVGMMVNADLAQPLQANVGALDGDTYRQKEQRLDAAARKRFGTEESSAWVQDFSDTQAVIYHGGDSYVYGYTTENGEITFTDTGTKVERQSFWAPVANWLQKVFTNHQARPDSPAEKEGDMPLTKEEKAELTQEISQAVTQSLGEVVANAIKPVSDQLATLETNHKTLADSLTAGARAEEAKMREAVKAKFGEVVANSLQGDALADMFKQCETSAGLLQNNGQQQGVLQADINLLPKE